MKPLKKIIGNARIVSLGEATHGTREFFQLKHRMLEFLASEMGFTIFSIEANMPEAYRVNDYVLKGIGDPAKSSGLQIRTVASVIQFGGPLHFWLAYWPLGTLSILLSNRDCNGMENLRRRFSAVVRLPELG